MKYLFIIFLLFSCVNTPTGPNYNVGSSHNKSKEFRNSVVKKEDSRMKNSMYKHRKKASRGKINRSPKKRNKYIN